MKNAIALGLMLLSVSVFAASKFDKPGFETFIVQGRLWVFQEGSKDLEEYKQLGEPAKIVTEIGVGPEGMTVRSADKEAIKAYLSMNKSE